MRILETPTAYLSPLQHLAKVGKELLVKIPKTRITNISDVKIEPEPMITSTTTHNISIKNICTDLFVASLATSRALSIYQKSIFNLLIISPFTISYLIYGKFSGSFLT